MLTKYLVVLIHIRNKGEVGFVKRVYPSSKFLLTVPRRCFFLWILFAICVSGLLRKQDLVVSLKLCLFFCVLLTMFCFTFFLAVSWIGQWSAIVTYWPDLFSLVNQIMFEQYNVHSSQNQDQTPNSKKGEKATD